MATKFLWNITHCEKYETNWEEKTKYNNVWSLFYNEDKGTYSVKMFGTFLPVFVPKDQKSIVKTQKNEFWDDVLSNIPF